MDPYGPGTTPRPASTSGARLVGHVMPMAVSVVAVVEMVNVVMAGVIASGLEANTDIVDP